MMDDTLHSAQEEEEMLLNDELILKDEPDALEDENSGLAPEQDGESILPDPQQDGLCGASPWGPPLAATEPAWGVVSPPTLSQPPPPSAAAPPDALSVELRLLQAARAHTEELNRQLSATLASLRAKEAQLDKQLWTVQQQQQWSPAVAALPLQSVPALTPLPRPSPRALQPKTRAVARRLSPARKPPVTAPPETPPPPPSEPDWPREDVARWCRQQQARTKAEHETVRLKARQIKALEMERRLEGRLQDVQRQREQVETETAQLERERQFLNRALGRLTPAWSTRSRTRSSVSSLLEMGELVRENSPDSQTAVKGLNIQTDDFQVILWKKDGVELSCSPSSDTDTVVRGLAEDSVQLSNELKRRLGGSGGGSSGDGDSVDGVQFAESSAEGPKPCKEAKLTESGEVGSQQPEPCSDTADSDGDSSIGLCSLCGLLLATAAELRCHLSEKHSPAAAAAALNPAPAAVTASVAAPDPATNTNPTPDASMAATTSSNSDTTPDTVPDPTPAAESTLASAAAAASPADAAVDLDKGCQCEVDVPLCQQRAGRADDPQPSASAAVDSDPLASS